MKYEFKALSKVCSFNASDTGVTEFTEISGISPSKFFWGIEALWRGSVNYLPVAVKEASFETEFGSRRLHTYVGADNLDKLRLDALNLLFTHCTEESISVEVGLNGVSVKQDKVFLTDKSMNSASVRAIRVLELKKRLNSVLKSVKVIGDVKVKPALNGKKKLVSTINVVGLDSKPVNLQDLNVDEYTATLLFMNLFQYERAVNIVFIDGGIFHDADILTELLRILIAPTKVGSRNFVYLYNNVLGVDVGQERVRVSFV